MQRNDETTPSQLGKTNQIRDNLQSNNICRCHSCGCESSRLNREQRESPSLMKTMSGNPYASSSAPSLSPSSSDTDDYLNDAITSQEGVEDHREQPSPRHHNHTPMDRWQHCSHEDPPYMFFLTATSNSYSPPLSPLPCSDAQGGSPSSLANEPGDLGSLSQSTGSLPSRRPSEGVGQLDHIGAVFEGSDCEYARYFQGPLEPQGFWKGPLELQGL